MMNLLTYSRSNDSCLAKVLDEIVHPFLYEPADDETINSMKAFAEAFYPGNYNLVIKAVGSGYHAEFQFHSDEDMLVFYLKYA